MAEAEAKRADGLVSELKATMHLMEKFNQERDGDRKELDKLRTHNRLMRGSLEVEQSELLARLKHVEHRLAMIPVEPLSGTTWGTMRVMNEWSEVK